MSVTPSETPPIDSRLARQRRRFSYRTSAEDRSKRTVYPVAQARAQAVERLVSDKSMKTFVAEWDHKIERTIEGLRMGDHLADIKQDVYVFMCRKHCPAKTAGRTCGEELTRCLAHGKRRCSPCGDAASAFCPQHRVHRDDGKTGLELYDPSQGSLSVYVYHAATMMALNYRAKLGRDRLQLAYSTRDDPFEDQRSPESSGRSEFWLQMGRIADSLDDQVRNDAGSFFDDGGHLVTRDPRTVLALLMEGMPVQKLPEALRCTRKDIDRLLGKLRRNVDLKALLARVEDEG